MSHHIKRIPSPKTWSILRKEKKFIVKPAPGPHNLRESISLAVVIRDMLNYAKTLKEVRALLLNKKVMVDGRVIKDPKFPVGLFDIISFPNINESYRLLINTKNKLYLKKLQKEESNLKIVKITTKKLVKKMKQYGFNDARTLLSKENYNTSDSLIIELPTQKIIKHIPFEIGNLAYLTAGTHVGEVGKIKKVIKERKNTEVIIEGKNGEFETLKKYVILIGKDKPEIKISIE